MRDLVKRFKELVLFLRFLGISKDPLKRPIGYYRHSGEGKSVSVRVLENHPEQDLIIQFQRKIRPSDVQDGKCLPLTWERLVRRGGKRSSAIRISIDNALELQSVLEAVLKDIKNQQVIDEWYKVLMVSLQALQSQS